MKTGEIREFLEEKTRLYNQPSFIENDPIQIPRCFSGKENAEISGFLVSTIAWGQRAAILKNGWKLMHLLGNDPFDFIMKSNSGDFKQLSRFVHRTFNGEDAGYFLESLQNIYLNYGGLEQVFAEGFRQEDSVFSALRYFRHIFFRKQSAPGTLRHLSDVTAGSAAKRLNLFLRWMVRSDDRGVDLGLWKSIPASALMLPLDVHTSRVARKLGLLQRKTNDWKAVEEITHVLKDFDPQDPVKYDYALFGLGIFEQF